MKNPVHHVHGGIQVGSIRVTHRDSDECLRAFSVEGACHPSIDIYADSGQPDMRIRTSIECTVREQTQRALFLQLDIFVMECLRMWNEPVFVGHSREQFMLYPIGSSCATHVDDQFVPPESVGKTKYGMHLLNQVAGILYISSDDLCGGELVFPEHNISIPAKTGTVVCFPSNMDYPHSVNEVIRGTRIALARHYYVKDSTAA